MNRDAQPTTPQPTDAVALLMSEHTQLKALFERYEGLVLQNADYERKQVLAEAICWALTVHTTAKEEIFYPAAVGSDADAASHALSDVSVKHHRVRHLVADIVNMAPSDPRFDTTVKTLSEHVDRHVREDEGELFPKVRASGIDLTTLGARLAVRKSELMAEVEATTEA